MPTQLFMRSELHIILHFPCPAFQAHSAGKKHCSVTQPTMEIKYLMSPGANGKKSCKGELQKAITELFEHESTLQLKDILKTDALSFALNRETNTPQKPVIKNSMCATPKKDYDSCMNNKIINDCFVFRTDSCESIYANAEQIDMSYEEDSTSGWVTESCCSSDPSPTPTLTELNVI